MWEIAIFCIYRIYVFASCFGQIIFYVKFHCNHLFCTLLLVSDYVTRKTKTCEYMPGVVHIFVWIICSNFLLSIFFYNTNKLHTFYDKDKMLFLLKVSVSEWWTAPEIVYPLLFQVSHVLGAIYHSKKYRVFHNDCQFLFEFKLGPKVLERNKMSN